MIFKAHNFLCLFTWLWVWWTHVVTWTLVSPVSSLTAGPTSPSEASSSPALASIPRPSSGRQSTPSTTFSSSSAAFSPSLLQTPGPRRGHSHSAGNGTGVLVSTSPGPFPNPASLHGSGLQPASSRGQPTGSTTHRSETATVPTASFRSEGALRDSREAGSLTPSVTVDTSPASVVFQTTDNASSAQSRQPSSSSRPAWTGGSLSAGSDPGANSASGRRVASTDLRRITPLLDAHTLPTPVLHATVSDPSAEGAESGVFSVSASADGTMLAESLVSSSVPTWQVTDFSASWPDANEADSFESSPFLPRTTPHGSGVPSLLEPSSDVHFTSSVDVKVLTSSVPIPADLPAATHSAETPSSWSHSSAPASWSSENRQQTSDGLLPSQTTLSLSLAAPSASTPSSTLTFLSAVSTHTQDASPRTRVISASATVPPGMATERTAAPPSVPTLDSEATQPLTLTPLPNTTTTDTLTTTTTTTTTTTQPARRDVRYQFTLTGDCHLILNNTEFFQRFLAGFHDLVVKQLGLGEDTYRLGQISCGTVHVFVTFLHVTMPDFHLRLQAIIRNGGPGLSIPVWIDSHFATFDLVHAKHVPLAPDEHTYNIVAEVMDDVDIIVIIVACCICGVLIAIGIAICVKECYRRKHASSFSLLDVPDVNLKLEDFTLTTIPRPRTIYKEPGAPKGSTCSRGGPGSSAVYADLPAEVNGYAKGSGNGSLHPSDLHLRIREHSDGIIVGVTAAMTSSRHPGQQGSAEETEGFIHGSARRSKARIRTPPADDTPEGEYPASQRLLPAPQTQGETEGTANPVFVDEREEEKSRKEREGAL